MFIQLVAKQATLLKQRPVDSSTGNAGKTFNFSPADGPIEILSHEDADGQHIKVLLNSSHATAMGFQFAYAWLPHVEVQELGHPDPEETQPVTNLERDKSDRGSQINTPVGPIYLNDPIHPKAPNFLVYELTRNGERIPPTREMWGQMQAIALAMQPHRDKIGEPCIITSAYRPGHINRAVGGVPDSRHTTHADAIDFYFPSMSKQQMWDYFNPFWPGGLGMYRHSALHADCRPYHARWGMENY